MGIFETTIQMIWPIFLVGLLVFGILWFVTSGPIGQIFKGIFGTFTKMIHEITTLGGLIPGSGGGGHSGGISSIPVIGPILGSLHL